MTPTFCRSLSSFIITKNKIFLYLGSFNYFAFTIHTGSNCYINTGVRHDLEFDVAFFTNKFTWKNDISSKNLLC